MSCTCRSVATVLRQPTRRIAQPTWAALSQARSLSSSTSVPAVKPTSASSDQSSCPAGTVLKGLNYIKDGQDPVALEDAEYPPWLFQLATNSTKPKQAPSQGDAAAASLRQQRTQLKQKGRAAIKAANELKG